MTREELAEYFDCADEIEQAAELIEQIEMGDEAAARELVDLCGSADTAAELTAWYIVDRAADGDPGIAADAVEYSDDGYGVDGTASHTWIQEHDYYYVDGEDHYVHIDGIIVTASGENISRGEYENGGWFTCGECGEVYSNDYGQYHEQRCENICDDCISEIDCGSLHDYSADVFDYVHDRFRVGRHVHSVAGKRLLFGVEVETQAGSGTYADAIAESLISATDFGAFGICKSDGSVTGPECVTVPGDLKAHREVYSWADWCRALRNVGAYGHGSSEEAGMHVHINKAALSQLTVSKILYFVNDSANARLIEAVAQRSPGSYTQRSPKKLGQRRNYDRYELVNITPRTVEIRMFHSNLREERILKNIEFCHALVTWLRDVSLQTLQGGASAEFAAWVFANRKDYPALHAFMAERVRDYAQLQLNIDHADAIRAAA
jgi:hypothetical protein